MDILTPPLQVYNDRRLSEFTAPAGDVWSTNIDQTLHDLPVAEYLRSAEMAQTEGRPIGGRFGGAYVQGKLPAPALSPLLLKDDAQAQIKDAGLDGQLTVPDDGIRKGSLDLLIANKKEQNRRASILSRSPGGVALGAANILSSLVVSTIDPVNDLAAFLPVVGEARYARMLAAAGGAVERTAIRAGVGAAEGAVGMAALQPLAMASARQYQEPYGINDALANVLYGGAFGALMHAGVVPLARGGYRMATGRSFMEKQAAAAEAVSAILEDRPVRVGEMLEATRARDLRGGTSLSTRAGFDPTATEDPIIGRTFEPSPTNNAPAFSGIAEIPQLRPNGEPAAYPADLTGFKSEIDRLTKAAAKEGRTLELRQQPDGSHILAETSKVDWLDQFPERPAAEAAWKRIPPAERAGIEVVPFETQSRGTGFALVKGLTKQQAEAIRANPGLAERITGSGQTPEPVALTQQMQAGDLYRGAASGQDQIASLARDAVNERLTRVLTQIRDDRVNLSPRDAATVSEVKRLAKLHDRPQTDGGLSELESYAAETDDALATAKQAETLSETETAAIDEANKMVADAEKIGNGLRAAAACIARAL